MGFPLFVHRAAARALAPGGILPRHDGTVRRALASVTCAVLTAIAPAAWSQAYPAKTVRIVVPFAAGGPADIYARMLGQRLQEALGQPFIVENRPGAGSIIGTDIVAKAPADGYTLLLMSNTHTVNESLIPKKPFTLMKDFVGIAPVNYSDLLMVVHPSLPAKSVKEFVAARQSRNRGRSTTPRPATGRPITWPASSSRRWRKSTSCTCRIKAVPRRARA